MSVSYVKFSCEDGSHKFTIVISGGGMSAKWICETCGVFTFKNPTRPVKQKISARHWREAIKQMVSEYCDVHCCENEWALDKIEQRARELAGKVAK